MASDPVFPLWAPDCHLREWQFGSFFAEIPLSPTIKVPIYRRFRGVGREKSAPLLPTLPPPPYAPEAIASLNQAVYVRTFYLCRKWPSVAAEHVSRTISAVVASYRTRKAPACLGRGVLCAYELEGVIIMRSAQMLSPEQRGEWHSPLWLWSWEMDCGVLSRSGSAAAG